MEAKPQNYRVVWADGTIDGSRICFMCESHTCSNPVHNDCYKVLSNKEASKWDEAHPAI